MTAFDETEHNRIAIALGKFADRLIKHGASCCQPASLVVWREISCIR
jgi:hypothetical protein